MLARSARDGRWAVTAGAWAAGTQRDADQSLRAAATPVRGQRRVLARWDEMGGGSVVRLESGCRGAEGKPSEATRREA